MQGDTAVIELLNEVLTGELTAINQYFVDAEGWLQVLAGVRSCPVNRLRQAQALPVHVR